MIRQARFTPVELGKQMQKLGLSADGLTRAAARARDCGRPHAARDLADLVETMGAAPEGDILPLTRQMPSAQARLQGAAA
jgi:UDP-N-acetylglucosamine--N-acetylmuramyl-(pentapeptide) pyrophosphoryl-undecaprenol N-acetylglucosamine transferase